MSGLFQISKPTVIAANPRHTKAKIRKNHACGEFGIKNPNAELALGI